MLNVFRRLINNPIYIVSMAIIIVIIMVTLLPGLFAPYDPYKMNMDS
ncbi:MAG TPA: ABC transporter permease, partial [Mesotoga sp.]|nr:ABC transporter permease [Mesotoga sp.]